MSKLTLSVDDDVVTRAKRYAQRQGTSVSRLVETYLDALARPPAIADERLPASLRRLRGILRGVKFDREDYVDYLERKYR
jgi:antitoxin component of RelBE/YafQ-DinJ toxin-antitoxin module